jgi:hypothetical protein
MTGIRGRARDARSHRRCRTLAAQLPDVVCERRVSSGNHEALEQLRDVLAPSASATGPSGGVPGLALPAFTDHIVRLSDAVVGHLAVERDGERG